MQAEQLAKLMTTKPMRRALLHKSWIPRGRSGGEVLLAERLAALGLFEGDREGGVLEYVRTKLGDAVCNIVHRGPNEGAGELAKPVTTEKPRIR